MAASVKSRRACGPSFVFLAKARSWDALKSPRNDTGIAMTNLHRSPPMNKRKTDLGIVNESQLLRFGIRLTLHAPLVGFPAQRKSAWKATRKREDELEWRAKETAIAREIVPADGSTN